MGVLPKQTVERSKKLAPGAYEGRILAHEVKDHDVRPGETASYVDLNIAVKVEKTDEPVVLTVGYPVGRLTPDGFLGKLLTRFGTKLDVGTEVDVQAEVDKLIDRDVILRIFVEKKFANGQTQEFSRIDRDSVRPKQ